jgi:ABC-type nickel/cobalt efflux system permease component RcnA
MAVFDLMPALQDLHRVFHDSLVGNLRALQEAGSVAAFVSLVAAGFLYGVLHAIGPGHGKVIIGAYMFADDHTLRRGLLITALSSLLQAAVAITLVLILFLALGLAQSTTESAAAWLELASFGLLGAIGGLLVVRGARFLRARANSAHCHEHPSAHRSPGRCTSCGHAPTSRQLRDVQDVRSLVAIVASIGLRPCSGALLLMALACMAGQIWAGIAATLAMAVGTGISVAAVAIAALQSRKWLLNLVSMTEARLAAASGLASIFGGAAIIVSVAILLLPAISPLPNDHPARHDRTLSHAR